MQQVSISGVLNSDSEQCTDVSGRTYLRFTVRCESRDKLSRKYHTYYTCFCYIGGVKDLKKDDQVFVTGKQSVGIKYDKNNSPYPYITVMVYQISQGLKANSKTKGNR